MKTLVYGAMIGSLLLVIGCGSDKTEGPSPDTETEESVTGKADGFELPVGTYEQTMDTAQPGQLTRIVLKTDLTFHAERVGRCEQTPCVPYDIDGTFKYTRSTTTDKRYLKLENGKTGEIIRYQWELLAESLDLTLAGEDDWFTLKPADLAWCAADDECLVQDLPRPRCMGQWSCVSNTCEFAEESCPEP